MLQVSLSLSLSFSLSICICIHFFAANLQFVVSIDCTVTVDPSECARYVPLFDWDVKRFGPYFVCLGGRVEFMWRSLHGVFQIPTIGCPSNFTGQEGETYKFLAPTSNGGSYLWEVPNKTGQYWITSQSNQDCAKGRCLW